MNTPGGRQELAALGARSVPVLAKGAEWVFCQAIQNVAKFIGVELTEVKLPPDVLIAKWFVVLATAQRLVRQLPASVLQERIHPDRDQSVANMGYHVLRIGQAFVDCVTVGTEDWLKVAMSPTPEGWGAEEIARYGDEVRANLERWWATLEDRQCTGTVKTYSGDFVLRDFLERQTWHSAQHTRQVAWRLEGLGITPDRPLTAETLAGLPVPEALWA